MTLLSTRDGLAEGERRRNAALADLAARRSQIVTRARRALLARLLDRGTATADDVRAALGELPPRVGPRYLGAVPGELVRAGIISSDGYVRTTRPQAHARPVAVWRLRDAEAARRWLVDHPEPAAPTPAQPWLPLGGLDGEETGNVDSPPP